MTWNILKLRIHLNTSGLCFFELSDAGLWRNILQWAQLQSAAIANGVLITHVLERLEELGLSQNLCMGGMAETGSSAAKAAQRYPALSHLPQMTSFLQKNGALVASNGDPALLHPLKLRKCLWIARSILSSCYFCRACPFIVLLFTAHTEYIRRAFFQSFGSFGPCLRQSPCACAKQAHQIHLSHINLHTAKAPCPWPGKPASTPRIYKQHVFFKKK